MDHQRQDVRHAALQAFMESLDLLERSLKSAQEQPPDRRSGSSSEGFDLTDLEAAAADIEQNLSIPTQPDSP